MENLNKKVKFAGARCLFSTFLRLQGDHHCAYTKVVSFFIFFQELSNKKKTKALRPKMTKIASALNTTLPLRRKHLLWWTRVHQLTHTHTRFLFWNSVQGADKQSIAHSKATRVRISCCMTLLVHFLTFLCVNFIVQVRT